MTQLAQINIGRLRHPPGDPRIAEFIDNLDRINALAERSPGFVWRYQDDSGAAIETALRGDPLLVPNLSVWESVEALESFVFATVHRGFYQKRADWFRPLGERHFAMWWVADGHRPTIDEGLSRLDHLNRQGADAYAFGWEEAAEAGRWREARCQAAE